MFLIGASQSGTPKKPSQCGGRGGLVTASGTTGKTICCKYFFLLFQKKNNIDHD